MGDNRAEEGWHRNSLSEVTSHPGVSGMEGKSYDQIFAKNIPVKGISQGSDHRPPLRESRRLIHLT